LANNEIADRSELGRNQREIEAIAPEAIRNDSWRLGVAAHRAGGPSGDLTLCRITIGKLGPAAEKSMPGVASRHGIADGSRGVSLSTSIWAA
jgi:hypothetical protein